MGTIYRVHEGNPRLHYYNNALDYYALNTPLKCNVNAMTTKTKIDTSEVQKQRCRRSLQLLNVDEDLHKRVLHSRIVREYERERSIAAQWDELYCIWRGVFIGGRTPPRGRRHLGAAAGGGSS
jgi:hypothetical protein